MFKTIRCHVIVSELLGLGHEINLLKGLNDFANLHTIEFFSEISIEVGFLLGIGDDLWRYSFNQLLTGIGTANEGDRILITELKINTIRIPSNCVVNINK